jgi:predicted O-linked N-acetylglucosamine transferase (SPINDLY family)
MLCREGRRWYNRIGPAMLRGAGFPELVVDTAEEYVERALRLIHDDPWRESLVERFRRADLDATIYDRSDADHFIAAIDYLIENHGRLKAGSDRAPLRFPRN